MAQPKPLALSYLGPEGTFSHMAAVSAYGAATLVPVPTIMAVFRAVALGETALGVAPIENSTDGGVGVALDGLLEHDLQIQGEIVLQIEQCLVAQHTALEALSRVYSHPQGLGQCRTWLAEHLPKAELYVSQSTSAAAQEAARDAQVGAIASSLAAQLYGLKVVASNVQDIGENITRFIVLGHTPPAATGNDKTSLAFSTPHERGALRRVLEIFDQESLNLTRIESRPARRKLWEYVFFVDIEGHASEPSVARALARVRAMCGMFRVLGSYPRASPVTPLNQS